MKFIEIFFYRRKNMIREINKSFWWFLKILLRWHLWQLRTYWRIVMSKNEYFDHRFLEKIEDIFDFCNSFKSYKLFCHSSKNFDFFRKVSNETSIELDEIHKNLHFLQIDKTLSIDYDFDIFRIHAKIIDWKQHAQKDDFFLEKLTFLNIYL